MKKSAIRKPKQVNGPGSNIMFRVYTVFTFLALFALAVIIKVAYIQLFEGEALKEQAIQQEYRFFDTDAVRGNIYASDGSLLATSIPIFEVRMDVASELISDKLFNDSVTWLARSLSKKFGDHTQWEYKQKLIKARADGNRYFLIQKNVSFDDLREMKTYPIFNRGKYKGGIIALRQTRRAYPYGMLARRTVGYANPQENLFVGLEGNYNSTLEGNRGRQLYRRMANSAWKPVSSDNNVDPDNGRDIITTIDPYLQDVTESALMRHIEKHKAEKGTAILMEVKTGEIKAIANLQLDKKDGKYKETYNIAVGELIEPGSTFKLPSMMVALENGWISKSDSVEIGDGWYVYHNRTMKDSHLIDADGWLTPYESFVYSSNVGVSRIINDNAQADPWSFIKTLNKMFYSDNLNVDIQGGQPANINNPDSPTWSKVSLPWISIGYELTVTPLHMLAFYNAVANDGVLVKPKFVNEIREAGVTIQKFETEVLSKKICSDATLAVAQDYLEGVVEKGTAKNISNAVYKIAGKTGTAQIAENGKYIKKYNASFAGYFPADEPKYSCMVLIHKPDGGSFYATTVAAPVFKEIADVVYATQLDIHPEGDNQTIDVLYAESDGPASQNEWFEELGVEVVGTGSAATQTFDEFISNKKVPDVRGMGVADAIFILENLGLKTRITGKGRVKSQSISAGSPVRRGDEMYLTLEI
jgi:cell division protein FtsI (penicillin-binding protein 3)